MPSTPTPEKKPFGNIVEKRENAGNQHFIPFPTIFSIFTRKNYTISATNKLSSASAFNLGNAEILSPAKRLKLGIVR